MEEELNENDLEERLYAMIHHVDGTQADENTEPRQDEFPRVEDVPRSTVKRYWRTSHNSPYQKINTPKDTQASKNTLANVNKNTPVVNKSTPVTVNRSHAAATKTTDPMPKEEKNGAPHSPPSALAILQNTAPQNFVKTVEILEIDEATLKRTTVVELESSDEDEVIEVALPPKPTITIESSDEDELIETLNKTKNKEKNKDSKENKSPNKSNRDVSASPVPSVVSTMSDDFIRGDCLALNISSAQPDNQSFDFSLHGSDLLGDGMPSKKKRKKKSKDRVTSTPIAAEATQKPQNVDNIFATPKSKAKNKKSKAKSYTVSEKIIPNADVYDSDSNQSVLDVNKNHDAYIVTEKSFPSADVYESDSSVAESIRDVGKQPVQSKANSSDSNAFIELSVNTSKNVTDKTLVVDLTSDYTTLDKTGIEENIVIGNVSGYSNIQEYGDNNLVNTAASVPKELGRFCSTKVPQILYEDLDFDNLKGKDKVCRRRRYSLTTLRAEMEKFYNESWGGENFNHQEIQKNMSRDKSLWVIDPKDRMPNPPKRRITCNYCNRVGHRDDTCRLKPPVCHMCGHSGHYEPRCPRKICVNCGSPNFMYSTMCCNCAPWRQLTCAECGQPGHPASHCPDIWRRYHNTIDENMPLEACSEKPRYQLQCSGCARRGHLAHACRAFISLCALPVHSPRVARYWRLYPSAEPRDHSVTPDAAVTPRSDKKRPSKSPTAHLTHVNKKRMTAENDPDRNRPEQKQRNNSQCKDTDPKQVVETCREPEKAPDFIPIGPNRDKKGHVIQDNAVSDTSEVRTSARIYMAEDTMARLRTPQGQQWMTNTTMTLNVDVLVDDAGSFLTVVGTVGDQEAFQADLRAWRGDEPAERSYALDKDAIAKAVYKMPRNKNDILRKLDVGFKSLQANLGDPKAIYKKLTFLLNRHETIKNQKVISPQQLSNNRGNINDKLQKLNMVLLGQAGLAGGAERLDALHCLREKLISVRSRKVPSPLHSEISQHYQIIFTPLQRNDYQDLMQKFYSEQPVALNETVKPKFNPRIGKKNQHNTIMQQTPVILSAKKNVKPITSIRSAGFEHQKPSKTIKTLVKKLAVIHSLLLKGNSPKRLNIADEVHSQMMLLNESAGQTQKERMENMKKALKVQRQANSYIKKGKRKNLKKQKQRKFILESDIRK